ncbi:GNAT family N-acetyltransferase [Colwelliaceae bacterium 6441]
MTNSFRLTTQRFILKTLTPDYASQEYLSWLSQNETGKFILNKPQTIDDLKQYIKQFCDNHFVYFLAIIDKDSNLHIGNIKFEFLNNSFDNVEMGILIGNRNYHGKGVAGEVIKGFAHFSVDKLSTKTMSLGVNKSNTAAVKAYEKLGFQVDSSTCTDNEMMMSWDLPKL